MSIPSATNEALRADGAAIRQEMAGLMKSATNGDFFRNANARLNERSTFLNFLDR